jgi:hypothetical protein
MCPGCSNHTYDQQYGEQIQYLINREAAGLGLAARPEEEEGGRASVVRERRGGGRWAGGSGSGMVGWAAWAGWQAKAEGVGGPAGLEKKVTKEIH